MKPNMTRNEAFLIAAYFIFFVALFCFFMEKLDKHRYESEIHNRQRIIDSIALEITHYDLSKRDSLIRVDTVFVEVVKRAKKRNDSVQAYIATANDSQLIDLYKSQIKLFIND